MNRVTVGGSGGATDTVCHKRHSRRARRPQADACSLSFKRQKIGRREPYGQIDEEPLLRTEWQITGGAGHYRIEFVAGWNVHPIVAGQERALYLARLGNWLRLDRGHAGPRVKANQEKKRYQHSSPLFAWNLLPQGYLSGGKGKRQVGSGWGRAKVKVKRKKAKSSALPTAFCLFPFADRTAHWSARVLSRMVLLTPCRRPTRLRAIDLTVARGYLRETSG
jgi:hypothetical protein